jgi:hypothetical protein
MITRDVLEDIDSACSGLLKDQRQAFEPHIRQADDGPHYVHVLRQVQSEVAKLQIENLNLPFEKQHSLADFAKLQTIIQNRLNEATDNPKHFEKVQWFARYWRDCVPYGAPTFTPITGPGMDVVTWRSGDLPKTYLE